MVDPMDEYCVQQLKEEMRVRTMRAWKTLDVSGAKAHEQGLVACEGGVDSVRRQQIMSAGREVFGGGDSCVSGLL